MFSRKSPCESRKRGKRENGGNAGGTLERVPQTPQNFSRINLLLGRRLCRFQGKCHPKQSLHRDKPVPPGFKPRGCKGRSPLHKITINLPLPRRGRALCERGRGIGGRKASGRQWQPVRHNKPTPQTNLRKTKKDAHAPSIQTFKLPNYQAIITKFISNRKEGREEEKKKLKRMKNRCTEEVQEVQALGQLVSVS